MKKKIDLILKKLIEAKRKLRFFKIQNSTKDNTLETLKLGLESIKLLLKKEQKSDNLIYSDNWSFNLDLPLINVKELIFSQLKAEEISKALFDGLLKMYKHLQTNFQNYKQIINFFPKYFQTPEILKKKHDEIILDLKEINNNLKTEYPKFVDKNNFEEIQTINENFTNNVTFYNEIWEKGEQVQGK